MSDAKVTVVDCSTGESAEREFTEDEMATTNIPAPEPPEDIITQLLERIEALEANA